MIRFSFSNASGIATPSPEKCRNKVGNADASLEARQRLRDLATTAGMGVDAKTFNGKFVSHARSYAALIGVNVERHSFPAKT
jgi:hypothetical protein